VGLALLLAGGLGLGGVAVTDALGGWVSRPASFRPGSTAARPAADTVTVPDALAVRDFDAGDERLYLLDPLAPAVHVLARTATGWQLAGQFGAEGAGPGEFSNPTGLAVLGDGRVAVIEPGRIHFFTGEGDYLESVAPSLPCGMPLPRVSAAHRGLFVHGTCLRVGGASDTMMAVLTWSDTGEDYELVASDPRFTTDGSFGHAYGSEVALSEGSSHYLFGAGSTPCVYRIVEGDSLPRATRQCEQHWRPYRLDLDRATRA